MPKIIFKIDLEKDARNYYGCANSKPHFGHDFTKSMKQKTLIKLKGKKWPEIEIDIRELLKRGYSKINIKLKLKKIENEWRKIEKIYFKKLERLTKRKIYRREFYCYVTTIGRCPYNKKEHWFMINIFNDIDFVMQIIAHELMHLQFYHYFEKYLRKKQKLSGKQFQDLKEALTVLLNLEFTHIIKKEDKGYSSHKELREFIVKEWKKEPDFDALLNKCVNYLKKKK